MNDVVFKSYKIQKKLNTKKIYLIRHGETDYNRQRIVQGSGVDSDLNDLGRAQATAFYQQYKDVPFDIVYTSKLKRTIQSVQSFLGKGLKHESYAGLNEINWGKKEGKRVVPEEDAAYYELLQKWKDGQVEVPIDGGESPVQVMERQKPVLELILSRSEEKNILICMHGRAMRIFLCIMMNYPIKEMDRFEHSNLCLYEVSYTGSLFTIDKFCDVEHLQELS